MFLGDGSVYETIFPRRRQQTPGRVDRKASVDNDHSFRLLSPSTMHNDALYCVSVSALVCKTLDGRVRDDATRIERSQY